MAGVGAEPALDQPALGSADSGMVRRRIAKPSIPGDRPDEAERAEQDEQRPPTEIHEQRGHQQGSQPAREVHAHEENTLRRAALLPREPPRKRPRGVRQGAGLTGAEQKPDRQQRCIAERGAREHGKRGPPADDPCQNPSRADPVAPPAGRNLERRVGDVKRAEDIPHLRRAEIEIVRDIGPRDRDGDPIQVGDGRQDHRHRQHFVADMSVSVRRAGETRGMNRRSAGRDRRVSRRLRFERMLHSRDMTNSRPKVLVTELEYRKAEARFSSAPGLECLRAPDAEGRSRLGDPRGARLVRCCRVAHLRRSALRIAAAGGVIARFGVGHDGIDKARATRAGLLCTNTPGVLNQSVAEHTMLLVAAAARTLVSASTSMAHRVWEPVMGAELQGKTLAIIGCGGIGRSVARIASLGYGMQVVGCSRPDAPPPSGLEHFREVLNDFAMAVRGADFVSLHISASRENVHFINRDRLAQLGERTWLINTARGSIVDEGALFTALAERRLAGAALDVFAREPYAPTEESGDLRTLANVILTPHVGSNTVEANARMAERALQNIMLAEARAFARMDLLNPEVLRRA